MDQVASPRQEDHRLERKTKRRRISDESSPSERSELRAIMKSERCFTFIAAGLLLILFLNPCAEASEGEAILAVRGLDVAILVDVSRSMRHFAVRPVETRVESRTGNGSDPERIRWDAVKLVLDLLTDEDRLLIQRFNHACPPKYSEEQRKVLNQGAHGTQANGQSAGSAG